ncbi:ankyrin repeat-containing domain protein [Pyronema omphalodes]|nr:ankyrin repeat-containing domain protein [Pyronema omphalodes]
MSDEGASPRELLLEACRRDNTDLLEQILKENTSAEFLNDSRDALGNTALHVAAQYGSYHVMDELLDQEGLEVDPINTMEQETPLHKAVIYTRDDPELGLEVVKLLVDAGADPRIRNKAKMRPIDIADARNNELKEILRTAEYSINAGDDIVDESNDYDEGDLASGSDDD